MVISCSKTAENRVKKNIPWDYHGMFNISGGARNLLPLAYERPVPKTQTKRAKTGKNREFLQKMAFLGKFYTTQARTRPQIFGILAYSTQNSLQKQRGIFWDISGNYLRITGSFISAPAPLETNQNAPTLPNFDIAVCL